MDFRLIMQVVINLVDNAVKYTPPGSRIEVTTEKKGEWDCVSVSDNGNGITDEMKEKIFDMFLYRNRTGIRQQKRAWSGTVSCQGDHTGTRRNDPCERWENGRNDLYIQAKSGGGYIG